MKIWKYLPAIVFQFFVQIGCTQIPENRPQVENPEFDQKLSQLLNFSVPLIGVSELKDIQREVYIFDTREWDEYQVSHIKGASYLGYDNFDKNRLKNVPKDATIVLYCSVGYRSEKIGNKLKQLGYYKVFNLYGSIFEWVNQGNPIVDMNGNATNRLHTYNKAWSKWVEPGKVKKTW